jgi:L-lysine exporter family protein LysE/ArgO
MNYIDFIQGFVIGLSLIVAIGPQNLFVIQQGLKKNYIFIVCLICSFSDSILVIFGIILSSYIASISPIFVLILKLTGGLWLILYGILKIRNSFKKDYQLNENHNKLITNVIFTTLFLTYANPHVYLDTIVLIGAISQNFNNKVSFGLGVITSSFLFFYTLGYFSKYLGQFIKNKKTWLWIDNIFGILMIGYGVLFVSNIF